MKAVDVIVGLALSACAVATVFPPYTFDLVGFNGAIVRDGLEWGSLFSPPVYSGRFMRLPAVPVIAWGVLGAEYLAIIFLAFAAIFLARTVKPISPQGGVGGGFGFALDSTPQGSSLGRIVIIWGVLSPLAFLLALSGAILLREHAILGKSASIDVVSSAYLLVALAAIAPVLRSCRASSASRTKKAAYIGIFLLSEALTSLVALGFLLGP